MAFCFGDEKMLVWVIYDISGNKIRNNIAKFCKNCGLYRVQKSAFLGEVNNSRIDELSLKCKEIIEETDSVYIFPIRNEDFKNIRLIGNKFDKKLVSGKLNIKFF